MDLISPWHRPMIEQQIARRMEEDRKRARFWRGCVIAGAISAALWGIIALIAWSLT